MSGEPLRVWLEAAGSEDVPVLAGIERRAYTHPWAETAFARAVLDPRVRVVVLREPGGAEQPDRGILAYCVLQVAADELQIHNIAVPEPARRRGLARRLLDLVLALASRQGARDAYLEVRASNAAAIALYRACGFEVAGRRQGYYESPREDALLMHRALESLKSAGSAC